MDRAIFTCKCASLAKSKGWQTNAPRIVGKGNHSADHLQKIKPRVENVCRELGLQYRTEENEGRLYVNLTGGSAERPPQHHKGGHGHEQRQQHGTQEDGPPGLIRKLCACCVIM